MYNITKGNVAPMKATLEHEGERFPIAVSTDISVRLYGTYKYTDAVNVQVDYDEDGVLYFDIPDTLSSGTYGVEVKGKNNGTPWRTATDCVVKITNTTQRDAGSEAVPEGDTYDIIMEVQLYKSKGDVEQHNTDPTAHPYILDELERIEGKIPVLPDHIVTDANYVHTDNNYTSTEKEKLSGLANYDDSEIRREVAGKVDKVEGKGLSSNDYTTEEKTKLANAITEEQDPTVPSWAKQQTKPSYNAQEVGALPNTTKYGSTIDLSMNSTTYVLTLSLKDQDGTVLNTKTVDLPIESVVVSGRYDATNKKIVLTLQGGGTIDVPVGDLIAGLQTEITSVNMLDADLVDDTNSTHKFVTAHEKTTWNNKQDAITDLSDIRSGASAGATAYQKPQGGMPSTDMSQAVQTSLSKADSALQQHQDISGKEDVTTIVVPVNATDATLPVTALTTEIGKYYRLDVPIETLGVTLPAMGVVTSVKTVTIYLTGGTTPAVTISAADGKSVVLQDGYETNSGKTYEVNCLYNGAVWVVGALTINTGE